MLQASAIDLERNRLRREWDRLRTQEQGVNAWTQVGDSKRDRGRCLGGLTAVKHPQNLVKERIEDVRNELMHKQKERLDLMAERLQLLTAFEPVDSSSFHQVVTGLLSEKINVLEGIKLRLILP